MLQPTLTNNGIALMVKAFCGNDIQFTKLKIGNGSTEGIDIKNLNDLINPIKNINISRIDRNDNNVILVGTGYDNNEVARDITWNEVGVYATDPDEGEILFAYLNTEDALEIIKSNQNGISIENNLSVMLIISSDINVSTVITSIQYASKQELLDHIAEKNPHNMEKEDIGLGNVENLAISDQKPEFITGQALTNIIAGDTMKTIISKLWAAIRTLTTHLTASNPHSLSPSKIGAAPLRHTHSTNDINSGILSVARGGTGAETATKARSKLGAAATNHTHSASDVNVSVSTVTVAEGYSSEFLPEFKISYTKSFNIIAVSVYMKFGGGTPAINTIIARRLPAPAHACKEQCLGSEGFRGVLAIDNNGMLYLSPWGGIKASVENGEQIDMHFTYISQVQ